MKIITTSTSILCCLIVLSVSSVHAEAIRRNELLGNSVKQPSKLQTKLQKTAPVQPQSVSPQPQKPQAGLLLPAVQHSKASARDETDKKGDK